MVDGMKMIMNDDAIKYFEQELESVSAFPAQALLMIQEERKYLETALTVLRKAQEKE